MPDIQNRNEDVLSEYSAMSTEKLQQLLREHASKPEGKEELSTETLLYIMEVLALRRQERNEGRNPEEALEEFRKYYEEDEESAEIEREPVIHKKNFTTTKWFKGLAAAAAVVLLIFTGSMTAKGFGFGLWDTIVKWTQETIHFGYIFNGTQVDPPSEDSAEVFKGLQDALDDYDITVKLVPQWIPAGYTETEVKVWDNPKQRQFLAQYQKGEKIIKIWIANYLTSDPLQIEQSASIIEVYEKNGIKYYIIDNEDRLEIAWGIDSFECYISGSLSVEELKKMVDSIEKG